MKILDTDSEAVKTYKQGLFDKLQGKGEVSKDSGITADVAGGVLQGTMMGAAVLAAGVLGAAITKKYKIKKNKIKPKSRLLIELQKFVKNK